MLSGLRSYCASGFSTSREAFNSQLCKVRTCSFHTSTWMFRWVIMPKYSRKWGTSITIWIDILNWNWHSKTWKWTLRASFLRSWKINPTSWTANTWFTKYLKYQKYSTKSKMALRWLSLLQFASRERENWWGSTRSWRPQGLEALQTTSLSSPNGTTLSSLTKAICWIRWKAYIAKASTTSGSLPALQHQNLNISILRPLKTGMNSSSFVWTRKVFR